MNSYERLRVTLMEAMQSQGYTALELHHLVDDAATRVAQHQAPPQGDAPRYGEPFHRWASP